MTVPPIFVDVCTAVGATIVIFNVGFLVFWTVRCAVIVWGDWRASRHHSSGPALPSREVRPVPDPNHPAVVPGGVAAAGTAGPHLRAVPDRRCEGGAA